MSNRPVIDLSQGLLAASQALLEGLRDSPEQRAEWVAFKESLTAEQREALHRCLDTRGAQEYAIGARAAIKAMRKHLGEAQAASPDQVSELKQQISGLSRKITELKAELAASEHRAELDTVPGWRRKYNKLHAELVRVTRERDDARLDLKVARGEIPSLVALPWDYAPVPARPQQADEVAFTGAPFGVEVVARQIEEFVRRQGKCSKPDVSSALPDCRPHLAAAYRHLHASKRIRVTGMTLEVWKEK